MARTTQTTLGNLISTLYDEFFAIYHDEEIASLAAAATVNDILHGQNATAVRGDWTATPDHEDLAA